MFHQFNDEGHRMMVPGEVIGHRTDGTEIGEKDAYDTLKGDKREPENDHKRPPHVPQMERWKYPMK